MSNPFKYGTVVSGKDFADRQQELKELADRLKEPVRIFLVAPRRYGKTSLIQNVLNTLQKEDIEQFNREIREFARCAGCEQCFGLEKLPGAIQCPHYQGGI